MRGRAAVAIGASAVLIFGAMAAEAGAAGSRAPGAKVTQLKSTGSSAVIRFDAKDRPHVRALPGRAEVRKSSGRLLSSAAVAPASLAPAATASASYSCVYNRKRRGFAIYPPTPMTANEDAYYSRHVFHLYRQKKARKILGTEGKTKQWEMCAVGGAHARGGNKLSRVVSMMTIKSKRDRLIGQKWDSGQEVSAAKANLRFAVEVKPVTIEGNVDVHPTYTITGAQGPDKQAPDSWESYVHNQVNAIWEGSDTFIWQGSTHFQGNVGHALWEFPQGSRTPPIRISQNHERFCGRLAGIGCA